MIAKLNGLVDSVGSDSAVIDVNGVGYLVFASSRTLGRLARAGEPASLLIETHVREDHIHLYGFATAAERDWFRLLTTVQGVGAKVALSILSTLAPNDLIAAIQAGDRGSLTRAPGVGSKLAVRLLTELREKAGAMPTGVGFTVVRPAPAGTAGDALSALTHLGYRRPEAQAAVAKVLERLGDDLALDAVIRESLKELAR